MEVHSHEPVTLTPLLSGKAPMALKRCPKCASFYLGDKACESCGYQLDFDGLGAPFSERSYYAMMESFYRERTLIGRLFPDLVQGRLKKSLSTPKRYPKELRLLARLTQRLSVLSSYFLESENYELSERKLYLIEWREVCLFLLNIYGEAWVSSKLDELITEKTKAAKVNLLMGFYSRTLEEFRRQPAQKQKFSPKILNYVGALMIIFLASISALALMKYMTLIGK